TFGLRAAATNLANFPKIQQAGDAALGNGAASIAQKGALLTAVASILRYYQNRGDLPAPSGMADAVTLNAFLKAAYSDGFVSNPAASSSPAAAEQIVNLWRAAE